MAISTSPGKRFSSGRLSRPLAPLKPSLELLEDRLLLNAGALDQSFGMGTRRGQATWTGFLA
jgi:hypothetical protein